MRIGSSSIATLTWMLCANTKRKHCDVRLNPDPFSLAPCSPPSRPLRAASGGGLRPVLNAAARGALPEGRSGRRDGSVRSNKGMLALNLSSASPPPMTDLLNFAHTTGYAPMHRRGGWVVLLPRGPRSGPGCAVPVRHNLIDPIRPTRRHIATSPQGGLYAMPSLCGSA